MMPIVLVMLLCIGSFGEMFGDVSWTQSTTPASVRSQCREKLLRLEDEHDDLMEKYQAIVIDYKEMKEEMKGNMECETMKEVG